MDALFGSSLGSPLSCSFPEVEAELPGTVVMRKVLAIDRPGFAVDYVGDADGESVAAVDANVHQSMVPSRVQH